MIYENEARIELHDVCNRIREYRPGVAALLLSAKRVEKYEDTLYILFKHGSTYAMKILNQPDVRELVESAVKDVMGFEHVHVIEESPFVAVDREEYARLMEVKRAALAVVTAMADLSKAVERGGSDD